MPAVDPPSPPSPPTPPSLRSAPRGWWTDAVADLVTGSRCVGCARPGRLLCPACRGSLDAPARAAVLDPRRPGLVPVWSATLHDRVARALVIAHKERGTLALSRPLGALLARAVVAAAGPAAGPLLLCPVPPRPGSVRRRGHDPTANVVRRAARVLRGAGVGAYAAEMLRSRGTPADQGDLDQAGRARNVIGSMTCPTPRLAAARRRHPHAWVIVCDDVVTTGATLVEAQRALAAVGVRVLGAATVTTTPRRRPDSHRAHG